MERHLRSLGEEAGKSRTRGQAESWTSRVNLTESTFQGELGGAEILWVSGGEGPGAAASVSYQQTVGSSLTSASHPSWSSKRGLVSLRVKSCVSSSCSGQGEAEAVLPSGGCPALLLPLAVICAGTSPYLVCTLLL